MAFSLSEMEGKLGEITSAITSRKKQILVEKGFEDFELWVEPDFLHIENLGVNVYSATICKFQEETQTYELDQDLYLFYDSQTGSKVYSECGSSLIVCVKNYCREAVVAIEESEELLCTYALDNGIFLREKVIGEIEFEIKGEIDI